jgi:hypothetical protein
MERISKTKILEKNPFKVVRLKLRLRLELD